MKDSAHHCPPPPTFYFLLHPRDSQLPRAMRRRSFALKGRLRSNGEAARKGPRLPMGRRHFESAATLRALAPAVPTTKEPNHHSSTSTSHFDSSPHHTFSLFPFPFSFLPRPLAPLAAVVLYYRQHTRRTACPAKGNVHQGRVF